MRGRAGVRLRVRQVEAVRQQADLLQEAARLAVDLGISADELLADAAALARRAQAAGATTTEQLLAFAAGEGGIPEDELRADLARIRTTL